MPLPEKSRESSGTRRIPTTMVHAIGVIAARGADELILPVHVHGDFHGLQFTRRIAQEIVDSLRAKLAVSPVGAPTLASRAFDRPPIAKPSGQLL